MAYTFKHGDRPLDGYTIQRAVGRGGFGEVYYALTDSGKQVALKYLRDNADVELRGIGHVMNLKSPHLITIYDVKQDVNAVPWVIMEYVSGPSLRDLIIADAKGMGAQKAAYFVTGIAKGLAYLHDRGIVHRDLKPGNIFYDDGYVKIGDYGLSKHIAISQHSGQTVSVGTVHYMAPEIGSGSYTKAIDIYALGVMLYEMLTGRLPFSGSSMGEILMRHLSEAPDVSGIPEPFAAVIAKSLAKDPKERYQDANEMADALMAFSGVSESISSFDPATISHVSRAEVSDAERTVTRTPVVPPLPPIPPMDARNPDAVVSIGDRLKARAGDLARRFEQRTAEWDRRIRGRLGGGEANAPSPAADAANAAMRSRRRTQFFTVAAIILAVSVATGAIATRPEAGVATAMLLTGATVASLLTYFKFILRSMTPNTVVDRIAYAGMGALFMAPALAPADEAGSTFQKMIIPLALVMGLTNWTQLIETGRRGIVQGGQAVWPGILGLIVASMAGIHNNWLAGGLCATLAIVTQAAAAMWPAGTARGVAARPAATGSAQPRTAAPFRSRASAYTDVPPLPPRGSLDGGGEAAAGQAASSAVAAERVAVNPRAQAFFGVVSALLVAVSLGCFFANIAIGRPMRPGSFKPEWKSVSVHASATDDAAQRVLRAEYGEWQELRSEYRDELDTKAGLLFGTLGPLAWLILFARKAFQKYELPVWRGTLRWAFSSIAFFIAAAMIALLAYQDLDGGERAGATFGLVASSVMGLLCMLIGGPRAAWETASAACGRSRQRVIGFSIGRSSVGESVRGAARSAGVSIAAVNIGGAGSAADMTDSQAPNGASAPPDAAMPGDALHAQTAQSRSEETSTRRVIDAAAPSFVGRTANAGMSLLGKVLLLIGMLVVIGNHAQVLNVELGPSMHRLTLSDGVFSEYVRGVDGQSKLLRQQAIPRAAAFAPLALGCVLLILARRNDRPAHVLRGVLGCAAGFVAAFLLLGPLSGDLRTLLRDDNWSNLKDEGVPLIICSALLLASIVLVFWPKPKAGRTIVI